MKVPPFPKEIVNVQLPQSPVAMGSFPKKGSAAQLEKHSKFASNSCSFAVKKLSAREISI